MILFIFIRVFFYETAILKLQTNSTNSLLEHKYFLKRGENNNLR